MADATVTGKLRGKNVTASWSRGGDVTGDTILLILAAGHVRAGTIVGWPGLEVGPADLGGEANPRIAAATLAEPLDELITVDVDPPPPLPLDATP